MRSYKHIGVKPTECESSCCLRVDHLGVRFGNDEILKDVGFHLHCGELIALIGPNGAGKSSLIKAILGQMPHTGTIRFHTAAGARLKPRIGYVPQSPSFDKGDPVSVLDLFVCSISGYPVWLPIPKALREQVRACLARVHGEDLIDKRVGMLSGGELQRVLLAMALEPLPQILILDEPFSGVDVEGERQLFALLDEVRNSYDLSILLCTHDFTTLSLMDKVLLLQKELLKAGTPEEVTSSEEFQKLFSVTGGNGGAA